MLALLVNPSGVSHKFTLGLDLGQARDYTALAVVERVEEIGELDRATYEHPVTVTCWLRNLARVPLETPYPDIVDWVAETVADPALAGQCGLVVDGTGVGPPVVNLLKKKRLGCPMTAVTITSGDKESRGSDGWMRVPKRNLIVGLKVMFEQKKLRIVRGMAGVDELMKEMMAMRVKVSGQGHESYGAPDGGKEGPHDDLVLAVALACWRAGRDPGAVVRAAKVRSRSTSRWCLDPAEPENLVDGVHALGFIFPPRRGEGAP